MTGSGEADEDLARRVRAYYDERRLRPEVAERLAGVVLEQQAGSLHVKGRRRWGRTLAVAATWLLAFGAGYGVHVWGQEHPERELRSEALARELALAHSVQFAFEVSAEGEYSSRGEDRAELRVGGLRGVLTALPFEPELPYGVEVVRVLGARYFVFEGRLGVQLRLIDVHGRLLTVAWVQPRAESGEFEPFALESDGVHVEVWEEGGVLVGVAQMSDDLG